ncbi:AEC family transporter [Evansella cellulosilytica]|uniref:Auxin Efflux Carrier n=1 Tax=Evansella cellulosilytica (strain ATCC 21833 / DSM 2522 / FERM P-1141 / JCM 9156 / N-4) TaxID=649639 RepID=E6TT07_EVAC2|nr:AEC family transporter [Evansella cellulosilytica]ADU31915.1 Auxin Efflux Carrier [Evansella cellulosilytica DSM 2522]
MGNFIFALSIIVLGLLVGRGIRLLFDKGKIQSFEKTHALLRKSTMTALLVVNPIILFAAFWYVQLDDLRLISLPALGLITLIMGGTLAIYASKKVLKLPAHKTGSMFTSGMFTNLGSFGALFCYVFLGEASLAFVALFRLFEDVLYYTVGFPVAQSYGEKKKEVKEKSAFMKIITNPFIVVTFVAILLGTILNLSPWDRPEFFATLNGILVPLFTILLVVPTGFSLMLNKTRGYLKEGFTITAIKYGIVPLIVIPLGLIVGLHTIYDGIPFKVLVILAFMPPGFSSLVPPQLFKLDVNLANSSWLINTVLLVITLPILYLVISFL